MNEKDLVRYLRGINPVDESQLESWHESDAARAILQGIIDTGSRSPSIPPFEPRRARPRLRTFALGAAVLVAVTAAAFALSSRPTTNPLSVGCYERLDQQADTAIVSLSDGQGLSLAAVCASRWESAFGGPAPQTLVTCVVSGGGLGVFPNESDLTQEEACASIHASLPQGGTPYGGLSAEQVRGLAADLEGRYAEIADRPGPECAGHADLKAQVQASLATLATGAWAVQDLTSSTQEWTFPDGTTARVSVPTTADGQRCAEYAIDAMGAKVVLVNSFPEEPTPEEPTESQ